MLPASLSHFLILPQQDEGSGVASHLKVKLEESQQQLSVKEDALAVASEEKRQLLNHLGKCRAGQWRAVGTMFLLPSNGFAGRLEEKYHTVLLEHSRQKQELSRLRAACAKQDLPYSSTQDGHLGGDEADSHTSDGSTRCVRCDPGEEVHDTLVHCREREVLQARKNLETEVLLKETDPSSLSPSTGGASSTEHSPGAAAGLTYPSSYQRMLEKGM